MWGVQKTKKQTKKQTNDWEGGEEEKTNVTAKSCFKQTQQYCKRMVLVTAAIKT